MEDDAEFQAIRQGMFLETARVLRMIDSEMERWKKLIENDRPDYSAAIAALDELRAKVENTGS